jgi:hypothetical protein
MNRVRQEPSALVTLHVPCTTPMDGKNLSSHCELQTMGRSWKEMLQFPGGGRKIFGRRPRICPTATFSRFAGPSGPWAASHRHRHPGDHAVRDHDVPRSSSQSGIEAPQRCATKAHPSGHHRRISRSRQPPARQPRPGLTMAPRDAQRRTALLADDRRRRVQNLQ